MSKAYFTLTQFEWFPIERMLVASARSLKSAFTAGDEIDISGNRKNVQFFCVRKEPNPYDPNKDYWYFVPTIDTDNSERDIHVRIYDDRYA